MNAPLSPQEREEILRRKVESGLYRSEDDVIDSALRLLDERDMYLEELKEKVQFGIEQIANGEYVEYTSETLHELFDEIEEEGLKRMEARRDTTLNQNKWLFSRLSTQARLELVQIWDYAVDLAGVEYTRSLNQQFFERFELLSIQPLM